MLQKDVKIPEERGEEEVKGGGGVKGSREMMSWGKNHKIRKGRNK